VTWFVDGVANGSTTDGLINNVGLYTAPTAVPSGGTVSIYALGSDGVTKSNTVTVTVTQGLVPVIVAYTNTGVTNSACSGGICNTIYAFNLSNPSAQIQVSPFSPSQDLYAAISPDQTLTAYTTGGGLKIETVPTGGGTPTLVYQWTDTHFTLMGLDWKPDGSGFVIADLDPTNNVCGLQTMAKNGSNIQQLTATNMSCPFGGGSISNPPVHPRYYSDGRIVYSAAGKNSNSQIFVLSADGKTATNLSNNGSNDRDPSWSPDGTKIVFSSDRNGSPDLYTMNADGTGAILALGTPSIIPSWCPGGKIVFEDGTSLYLWSVNVDGTGKTQLTANTSTEPYCR
jgi:Tol biopolymer transport system component